MPYSMTYADACAAMMERWYVPPTAWGYEMLRDWGACDASGQFVHRRNGASIVRQAGKSTDAVGWAAFQASQLGLNVLYSAHNYSTTSLMLERFRSIFGRKPGDPKAEHKDANSLLIDCDNSTSKESMTFRGGNVLCFSTRTEAAKLGYSFDVIYYDEAQELTAGQQRILLATTSSSPHHNPQSIYIGTPKRPGRPGDQFEPMREEAWGDPQDDLCWWEYGIDEPVDDVMDEELWASINPSIREGVADLNAIRMGMRQLINAPGGMQTINQEYLGWWMPKGKAAGGVIDAAAWDARAIDPALAPGPADAPAVFAIKFAQDGSAGCVAACRHPHGEPAHVEVVDERPMSYGMEWFVNFCESRPESTFVLDGGGLAQDLNNRLVRDEFDEDLIVRPSAQDVATACAGFLDAVASGWLSHIGQPGLDASAKGVAKRPIGRSGFGFVGIEGADALPAEACALAVWASENVEATEESGVWF